MRSTGGVRAIVGADEVLAQAVELGRRDTGAHYILQHPQQFADDGSAPGDLGDLGFALQSDHVVPLDLGPDSAGAIRRKAARTA